MRTSREGQWSDETTKRIFEKNVNLKDKQDGWNGKGRRNEMEISWIRCRNVV